MNSSDLAVPYWESPLYQGGITPAYFHATETTLPPTVREAMRLIAANGFEPLEEAKLCERAISEGEEGPLVTSLQGALAKFSSEYKKHIPPDIITTNGKRHYRVTRGDWATFSSITQIFPDIPMNKQKSRLGVYYSTRYLSALLSLQETPKVTSSATHAAQRHEISYIPGSDTAIHCYLFGLKPNDFSDPYIIELEAPSRESATDPFRSMIAKHFWERDRCSALHPKIPEKKAHYMDRIIEEEQQIINLYQKKLNKPAMHDLLDGKIETFNELAEEYNEEWAMELTDWSVERSESKIFSAMDALYEEAGYLNV